jgi:hypothetical protein
MKHSMKEAEAIQKDFEKKFGQAEGVTGIGICLSPNKDDLALSVFVTASKEASRLPKTFEGLDIVVETTGTVRAL